MEHLFLSSNDLKDKTLDELQEKISELTSRLTFAYRTQNGPMIQQLHMILESYRNQYNKKMDEVFEKQKLSGHIKVDDGK
jgi:DNA-binding ferritin-like protein